MDNGGVIDITDFVEKARSTFVLAGLLYIKGLILAVPGLGWLNLPIISSLLNAGLKYVLNTLSEWAVMAAFFENTAIRKSSQAQDYVDAVNRKDQLPPEASDAEYEKYELAEIDAFTRFVLITN